VLQPKEVQSVKGFAVGSGSQKTHVRCIQVANGCYTEWWELVTTVEQGDERCKTTVFSSCTKKKLKNCTRILGNGRILKVLSFHGSSYQLQNVSIISNAVLSNQQQNLCCHPLHRSMSHCWTPCPYR